ARPGASVLIVEPNGRNLLMRLLALARRHERGLLRNSVGSLRELIAPLFPNARYEVRQPMPLYRLILHHQFGMPALGAHRWFSIGMDAWDSLARRLIPRSLWAYVLIFVSVDGSSSAAPATKSG